MRWILEVGGKDIMLACSGFGENGGVRGWWWGLFWGGWALFSPRLNFSVDHFKPPTRTPKQEREKIKNNPQNYYYSKFITFKLVIMFLLRQTKKKFLVTPPRATCPTQLKRKGENNGLTPLYTGALEQKNAPRA